MILNNFISEATLVLIPINKKSSLEYYPNVYNNYNKNNVVFSLGKTSITSNNSNLSQLNLPPALQLNPENLNKDKIFKSSELCELVLPNIKDYKSKLLKSKGLAEN